MLLRVVGALVMNQEAGCCELQREAGRHPRSHSHAGTHTHAQYMKCLSGIASRG